jgi:hypothetical protein
LEKTDQLSYLTGQLLLLESRLVRKQKQIANILYNKELTIYRQQKIIEALSSRLEMNGLDHQVILADTQTECDLNDSDSAVVLEDIDDCNNSLISLKKKSCSNDVVRSISDVIQMPRRTLQKSNYLRRPDILETVYSVEEDPDANSQEQKDKEKQAKKALEQQQQLNSSLRDVSDVAEKRDKFKNRSDKRISDAIDDTSDTISITTNHSQSSIATSFWERLTSYYDHSRASTPISQRRASDDDAKNPEVQQEHQYQRVMSNHRSVTKPKDVKYKRINKAKSKSLEELRGKLKNWVEYRNSGSYNVQHVNDEA